MFSLVASPRRAKVLLHGSVIAFDRVIATILRIGPDVIVYVIRVLVWTQEEFATIRPNKVHHHVKTLSIVKVFPLCDSDILNAFSPHLDLNSLIGSDFLGFFSLFFADRYVSVYPVPGNRQWTCKVVLVFGA